MKLHLMLFLGSFVVCTNVIAAETDQGEEQCAMKVQMQIDAMNLNSKRLGIEQKIGPFTIQDLKELQNSKGSCFTAQEISQQQEIILKHKG